MNQSARLVLCLMALVAVGDAHAEHTARAAEPGSASGEGLRTRLTIVGLDGSDRRVVLDAPGRFGAPDWSPDGRSLVVNKDGRLWRVPVAGGPPAPIATGDVGWIDINHGLSPGGRTLAFTAAGALFRQRLAGQPGPPTRVTPATPSYFHGWSPDGRWLAYSARRGQGLDVYAIAAEGGPERRLTADPRADDAPQFSPDGRSLYFLSDRSGDREIWWMSAAGPGPNDARAERITRDARVEAAPHPSPDGRWLIYLAHPPRTEANALDRDALLRRLPLKGSRGTPGPPETIARLVGGHGTLGARPFSPDGRSLVYAAYELPPPTVRIVLFTPSDLMPPAGAVHRLTQIADAAERFLFGWMNRWKYPPAVDRLFRRNSDGTVEVTFVQGDRPSSDAYYTQPSCEAEAKQKASRQLGIDVEGHLWWVFIYVGDRPKRFANWQGGGNSRDGGGAIVNYDTIPGEIRPDLGLNEGFNGQYFLKGTIHELGHAFGLPHIGPDLSLGLGNSLMGANQSVYLERKHPKPDQVYLTEASAAILWKHPVLSGTTRHRHRQPTVKLADYKARYTRRSDRVTLTGRLVADMPAHSVVVLDDRGKPEDNYWYVSHVARLGPDGAFRVAIDRPARAGGRFLIFFCFDNGMPTGDGVAYGDQSAIRKSYQFRDGTYRFGD